MAKFTSDIVESVSTFILATKDTNIINSREVRELFKYHIHNLIQLEGYFDALFGGSYDLNQFEQGIYDEMLEKLNSGYTVVATIETEHTDQTYGRILEFINSTGIHVINDSEI